jgi:hypothetical protein
MESIESVATIEVSRTHDKQGNDTPKILTTIGTIHMVP